MNNDTQETVEIYVPLKDEGTPTIRPTQAIPLGDDLYKILATPDYDPEDETWEFLPGSIVRCDRPVLTQTGVSVLRAFAIQNEDGSFTMSTEIPERGPEKVGALQEIGSILFRFAKRLCRTRCGVRRDA